MNRKNFIKTLAFGTSIVMTGLPTLKAAEMRNLKHKLRNTMYAEKMIYPVGADVEVRIEIPKELRKYAKEFKILCAGDDGGYFAEDSEFYLKRFGAVETPFSISNDTLILKTKFPREQKYTFLIYNPTANKNKNAEKGFGRFNFECMVYVYALNSDLYALTPLKTDFHMHSTSSDGQETPTEIALNSLAIGLDAQSLSDHSNYGASVKLQNDFKDIPLSMKIYRAEEIHQSEVHILVIEAAESVTDKIKANRSAFDKRVAEYKKSLPKTLNATEKDIVAKAKAELEIVRSLKGRPVFAHPYWRRGAEHGVGINAYLSDKTVDALFDCDFDAVEAVNGTAGDEQTDLTFAALSELQAKGKTTLPAIGNSDAHNAQQHGKAYTIVFAKSNTIDDIWDAVKSRRTLSVDAVAGNKKPFIFGSRRLTRFGFFLLENYFTKHDALCSTQADIAKRFIKNNKSSEDLKELKILVDKVNNLYANLKY